MKAVIGHEDLATSQNQKHRISLVCLMSDCTTSDMKQDTVDDQLHLGLPCI